MEKSRTYASQEVQDAFLALPESNQDALAAIHETEAYAINDAMNSRVSSVMEYKALDVVETIEINGVRLEASDFGAPTQEQIERFGLIELKDGDEANSRAPQYGSYIISDYRIFQRAYPHYIDLTEAQARENGVFPVTVWGYNKRARKLMLGKKREPNDEEWGKLEAYAVENGNDALIKAMNAWYLDCPEAEFYVDIGKQAFFGVSDNYSGGSMSYASFLRGCKGMVRHSMGPYHLMVIRAIASEE